MEPQELKNAWKACDKSLEKLWSLNLRCIEMVQTQKAKSKLNALVFLKSVAVVLGILYVLFLGVLVYGNQLKNVYFTISIGMIMLITIISIVVYIKHIVLIRQINYSENIVDMQKKLAELQTSSINIARLIWLQLPFWCTWFWSSKWIVNNTLNFFSTVFPIALFFAFVAVWLFKNISLKNSNKKWFRILFSSAEWKSVTKAIAFINEIEEFKKDY
jgi:hypothetical protein